nr:MAG TPA: hypothetical protein [Caudoviricetes sp.]
MEWAGWQFGDRPTCNDCRWIHKRKQDCANCTRHWTLSPRNEEAMRIWHMLRQHGAPVDNMTGAILPIRHEALVAEIARHAEPEELLWRLRFLDAQFVELKNAERHKKEERNNRARAQKR